MTWTRAYAALWWLMVLAACGLAAIVWTQDLAELKVYPQGWLWHDVPLTLAFLTTPVIVVATIRWAFLGTWRFGWRLWP